MRTLLFLVAVTSLLLLTGCTTPQSQVSNPSSNVVPVNCSASSSGESPYKAEMESCEKTNLLLIQDRDYWKGKFEEVSNKLSVLQSISVFNKNPTKSGANYDYAYCGEKFVGDRSDCSLTIRCTMSMSPLFNCQEKLLFTTHKSKIEVGDVVDIKLPKPTTISGNVITNQIHIVRSIEESRYVTGSLNLVSEGFSYTNNGGTYYAVDEFKPAKQDIKGVLKGIVW